MKKYLLIIITAVFLISSVYVAIEASASASEMVALEEKEALLVGTKGELEGALVKGMSGVEIDSRSAGLGFVKPNDLIYLDSDAYKDQALINSLSY